MTLTVTVDGGGSGCRLAAFDAAETLLGSVSLARHASLNLDVDEAHRHIREGLRALAEQAEVAAAIARSERCEDACHREWMPDRLMMGLAGSLPLARRQALAALLPPGLVHRVVTDGHAQLIGSFSGRPGICLSVGTGSVLHWLDHDGSAGMAGGWGFPIGDEGSGAWLGFRRVQAYLHYLDGRRAASVLFDELPDRIGADPATLQPWLRDARSTDFAALAPGVFAAADAGDAEARALEASAVDAVEALLDRAPASLPISLQGSIGRRFASALAERLPERVFRDAEGGAAEGLLILSRRLHASGDSGQREDGKDERGE